MSRAAFQSYPKQFNIKIAGRNTQQNILGNFNVRAGI